MQRSRSEMLATACLLSIAVVCLLPIWIVRYLPLLDEGNHLSALYVLAGLRDSTSPLHEFYAARFSPVPYFLHYGLGYAFSYVVSVETAHKLALSVYVALFAFSAWAWCLRTERSVWLALPVPMLAYGVSWAHGYHAYNIGSPVLLLAIVAFDRLLAEFRWSNVVLAASTAIACYLSHAVVAALLLALVPLLVVLHAPPRRSLVATSLLWMSVVAAFMIAAQQSASAPSGWRALLRDGALDIGMPRVAERIADFPTYAFDVVGGRWDIVFGASVICMSLVGHLMEWRSHIKARALSHGTEAQRVSWWNTMRGWLYAHRSLVLMLTLGLAYVLSPRHLQHPEYMWIFAGRFVPLVLFFFLLASPNRNAAPPWSMSMLVGLAVVGFVAVISVQYRAFAHAMEPLERAAQHCPERATLLTVGMPPFEHPTVNVTPLGGRIAGWVQVIHGGFDPYYFGRRVPFPFAVHKTLPAPRLRQPERYAKPLRDGDYDCVLTHQLKTPLSNRHYTRVFEQGAFQLWLHRRRAEAQQ